MGIIPIKWLRAARLQLGSMHSWPKARQKYSASELTSRDERTNCCFKAAAACFLTHLELSLEVRGCGAFRHRSIQGNRFHFASFERRVYVTKHYAESQ